MIAEHERAYLIESITREFEGGYTCDLFARFVAERDALDAELARERQANTALLEAAQRMERERDLLELRLQTAGRAAALAREVNGHADTAEECADYLAHEIATSGDPSGRKQDFVDAIRAVVLACDAHEDASTPAFDEIAKLCGCPQWDYPGQLGQLWEDLEENFYPDMKCGGPCMEGLSPAAKSRLIDARLAWLLERGQDDENDRPDWEDWPTHRDRQRRQVWTSGEIVELSARGVQTDAEVARASVRDRQLLEYQIEATSYWRSARAFDEHVIKQQDTGGTPS